MQYSPLNAERGCGVVLFGLSISEYAHEHCVGKYSDSAIDTASRIVGIVSDLMQQQGLAVPDDATFKAYHEQHPKEKNATKPVKELLKHYFEYLAEAEQKGERDNVNNSEVVEINSVDNNETLNVEETRRKAGRKPKPPSEKRSVKLSIYITPRLADDVKTLAACSRQDISDITFTLLEDFVERNRDILENAKSFFSNLGTIK